MTNDPFHREQSLLNRTREILNKCENEHFAAEALTDLVRGYDKLLRQSRRLVTMGDRMQMTLNELNQNLAVNEQKFRGIFENVAEGIFRSTPAGKIIEINPAMAEMFGYSLPEAFMEDVQYIEDLFCSDETYSSYRKSLEHGDLRRFEVCVCSPKGKTLWAEVSTSVMKSDKRSENPGIVGVLADVTERKSMMEELCRLARTDSLTGLWNRGYFMEQANREIIRSMRNETPCSLLLLDVDFFKKVNDRYGHDIGDKVLKQLAAIMSDSVREIDIVARIGGEEFVTMLPYTNEDEARIVAERLAEKVRCSPVDTGSASFGITVSIGLSTLVQGNDLERMIKLADTALYAAKNNGRDRVEIYHGNS